MNHKPDDEQYWSPHTDVVVSKDGDLVFNVDLSGMNARNVEITENAVEMTNKNSSLCIRSVRSVAETEDASQLLLKEIPSGRFEIIVEVPDGFDLHAWQSNYLNGMLRIVVPRKAGPSKK